MSDPAKTAKALYTPPFRHEHGYIFDSAGNMVADNAAGDEKEQPDSSLRIRGWGRIGYLKNPEQIQDAVGDRIAQILTEHWND